MANKPSIPKGMRDFPQQEMAERNYIFDTIKSVFRSFGYAQIETPAMENLSTLLGKYGDEGDKLLFRVMNSGEKAAQAPEKGLRYDLTLPLSRYYAANRASLPQPFKVIQTDRVFRAERPQKGRQRQFNQVGIECLGADDPTIDAEGIIMLMRFYEAIGIPLGAMRLLVNSMGCESCRPAYREGVRAYILEHAHDLCEECQRRADTNPLRAFDCKKEQCRQVMAGAPRIVDNLCDDCHDHYGSVKALLDVSGVRYQEDYTLVRGLDYYTRTVFEVQVTEGMGSQNAIGGGGRYDKLMAEIGGNPAPGFGFALGYERCLLALQAYGFEFDPAAKLDIYVACVDDSVRSLAFNVVQQLRDVGYKCDIDHQHRSLKGQFKQADKLHADYVVVLGPDEVSRGVAKLRNMASHTELEVLLGEAGRWLQVFHDSAQALESGATE